MMARATRSGHGAILLEMLLALGLFVAASLTITATLRQGVESLTRSRDEARAADSARTGMSLIEAGIETPLTLDGPMRAWVDDPRVWEGDDLMRDAAGELAVGSGDGQIMRTGWSYEVQTEPSLFDGLTKVTITVMLRDEGTNATRVSHTLVQLVRLGEQGEDIIGEENEINEIGRRTRERGP